MNISQYIRDEMAHTSIRSLRELIEDSIVQPLARTALNAVSAALARPLNAQIVQSCHWEDERAEHVVFFVPGGDAIRIRIEALDAVAAAALKETYGK